MPKVLYTWQDRVSFVQQYYSGASVNQIRDRFAAEFPHRSIPAVKTIYLAIAKFKKTGSIDPWLDHLQSPSRMLEEKQFEISANQMQCRPIASDFGESESAVPKILNQQRYTPYKRNYNSQRVTLSNEERRMIFCEAFMEECNANPELIDTVCTSSQCSFSLRQVVDGQRDWGWNPEFDVEVTAWTGMVGDRMIGPFIVGGKTIKAEAYLVLLREKIVPAIRHLEQELGQKIYFQQDATPAHTGRIITDYLNSEFPNRWFGLKTRLAWPVRSPDLNPLEYFYWPRVKENVNKTVFLNLESLVRIFIDVHNQITPDQIREATRSLYHRLTYCTMTEGGPFENYL